MNTRHWLERVARRANVQPAEADSTLRRHGINPDRPLRPPRGLLVTRIAFRGTKRGGAETNFSFDWANLTAGVWAVASHDNLVGKSSVLEVLRWALLGAPKGLQADVLHWLDRVEVNLAIDDTQFRIHFDVLDASPRGSLMRVREDGVVETFEAFESSEAFSAAMSRFMMEALDLDPIVNFQASEHGAKAVAHAWPALAGALYFGGDHKLLLGDVAFAGLPGRLLQLYLGLPWARAVMRAATAKKEIDHELASVTRRTDERRARLADARAKLQSQLEAIEARLIDATPVAVTAERLRTLASELGVASSLSLQLDRRVAEAEINLLALRRVADDDARDLRNIREAAVAARFFNGLAPACCPRCEIPVTARRLELESTDLRCSLCAEGMPADQLEDTSQTIADATTRSVAATAAATHAEASLAELAREQRRAQHLADRAQRAMDEAATGDAFIKQRDAEIDRARLQGALAEQDRDIEDPPDSVDARIITAATDEARTAFEGERGDILEVLNGEICRLGVAFGIGKLERLYLDSNARMKVIKGGEETWFNRLTAGERLRLRIATAVALLRVGRARGVGRYPGLLIIDSPGAEETNETDLATVLAELVRISGETPGLQVFIASAAAQAVVHAVGEEHCRVAAPGEYLW